jgi:hypothetical protein
MNLDIFQPVIEYVEKIPATLILLQSAVVDTVMILTEATAAVVSPIAATLPYSLIVVAVVWGFVMLAYYFTDYFIIALSVIIKIITTLLNWYVFVHNAVAPVALPPLYSAWNSASRQ